MTAVDYTNISKNLKQHLDILKSNQIITEPKNTNADVNLVNPVNSYAASTDYVEPTIKLQDFVQVNEIKQIVKQKIPKKINLYVGIFFLLLPLFFCIIVYILKPTFIYKIEKTSKNQIVKTIDYNKLYITISMIYILCLIFFYFHKKNLNNLMHKLIIFAYPSLIK
jgi:hypothetical protein